MLGIIEPRIVDENDFNEIEIQNEEGEIDPPGLLRAQQLANQNDLLQADQNNP